MNYYIAVTDNNWYHHLKEIGATEANFWNPGGRAFRAVEPGSPFLFKLHKPYHQYIVGGGYLNKFRSLPLSYAWWSFRECNGAKTLPDFQKMVLDLIRKYRSTAENDPQIGCTLLQNIFFIPREHWVEVPADWHNNIVRGKTYSMSESPGQETWQKVQLHLSSHVLLDEIAVAESGPDYGPTQQVKRRLGQGIFRLTIADAYQKRCAISKERILPVLQAAHIKPISEGGGNNVDNGLLLRSDMHIMFDRGYITITPEYKIEVSNEIKHQFNNGYEYLRFHGKDLHLPANDGEKPNPEFLDWHNSECYERYLG